MVQITGEETSNQQYTEETTDQIVPLFDKSKFVQIINEIDGHAIPWATPCRVQQTTIDDRDGREAKIIDAKAATTSPIIKTDLAL
jgi:hypothetical protein